ncbi:dTDP-glucose 4,6-dehydratase [Candidatus Shapirobacteria bacterium CG09_land_8_20_14_0_10_38_17]|uniref:dTDP-glucose 4,6-dehydratase n=1 Tax=Candidatus Shapirobacteria bacterium CG09_land_8_20_14_0_10_38_17 TaxID=1974884 RepID=A0A2H0WRD8_9BACT|nr:MAG: dTDP-glucose 4,6-dehydratase [Candidatus Shapirobacteria bacterium CG09_land_8_20_14_0_10_38_17]
MTFLVTGGAGFIGTNFIRYWLENHPQDKIVNLDRLTYAGDRKNLTDLENSSRYQFVKGDIGNQGLANQLMKEAEVVVHFAAESHVDRSIENPEVFLQTNILGTFNLLEAALKNKIKRFHYISTDEVFGELPLGTKEKFNEETKFDPHSPYSASKAGADHLVLSYYHTFGLPITITNCSNNYGPYQYPEKFIPRMITNILDGKKIPIYGDGQYVRDWLYVTDHCRAIEAVLRWGKPGQTYCVGGLTKDVSNLSLAKMILKIMGKGEEYLEFVVDRAGHDRRYAVDWNKIKKELGWKPKETIKSGLVKTVFWYQQNESWWREKKKEAEEFYQKLAAKKI